MTGFQRRFQAGGILRFDGNHFDLRHQLFDQYRYARRQAAAANRHKDTIEMRILLKQLQRQRALPGDHHWVIKRRHPGKTLLLRQFNSFRFRFIKISAVQQHFAAKTAYRIDFNIRRCFWHDDQRLHAKPRGGERHALRMVPRRRSNHAVGFLFFGQSGHHRVSAAQLKAMYRLPVFAFDENNVIQT